MTGTCAVTACGRDADQILRNLNHPANEHSRLLESAVCDVHARELAAGEPWARTDDGLVVGTDAVAELGLVVAAAVGGPTAAVIGSVDLLELVTIKGHLFGSDEPAQVSILLTAQMRQALADALQTGDQRA